MTALRSVKVHQKLAVGFQKKKQQRIRAGISMFKERDHKDKKVNHGGSFL